MEKLKDGVGRSTEFLRHFDLYDFVRFLRARPGDLVASIKMLKQHIEWNNTHLTDYGRPGALPNDAPDLAAHARLPGRPGRLYLTEDAVENELRTGKAFIHKTDKLGRVRRRIRSHAPPSSITPCPCRSRAPTCSLSDMIRTETIRRR